MKFPQIFVSVVLSVQLVLGGSMIFESGVQAAGFGSRGGSFSSRGAGFSKSSSWSVTTHNTWDRRGGGILGPTPGSSSGYSKPSVGKTPTPSGYSKPSLTGPPTSGQPVQTGSKTSGGYAKPGASSVTGGKFTGGSKFDKETIGLERKKRAQESLEKYKSEQAKFKEPEFKVQGAESSPLAQKGKVYSGFDYGTHYGQRDDYYRSQGYQPPGYVYNTSPGFGVFNSIFLFWMLDHISHRDVAATAYHHSDDPGFQKWRKEAENLAKDNPELKAKLAEMDKQTKELEGTPKDPAYLPKGVPPEAALSTSVLASKKPEKPLLRFATGQVGGWYDKFGTMFKKAASGLDLKIITTNGSLDNLKLLANGEADLAIVQSDVLALIDKKLPGKDLISEQSTLYVEYSQLVANRDSGVKSVKDIDPQKNVIYVGPKGSGTALTWEGLCEQDERYRKIPIKYASYSAGLAEVQANSKALMMFVGGLNSDFLRKAEELAKKSGKLRLVAVDEGHFKDKLDKHGNSIYSFVEIPSNIYPSLQKGWFFSGDVKTLGVQAILVLRTEWAEKFGPSAMDALSLAILETKPDVQRLVNGTK